MYTHHLHVNIYKMGESVVNGGNVLRTLLDLIFGGHAPVHKCNLTHCKSRCMYDFTEEFRQIDDMYLPFQVMVSVFSLGAVLIDITLDPTQDNGCLLCIKKLQDPSERKMFVSMKQHSLEQYEQMEANGTVFAKNVGLIDLRDMFRQLVQPHLQDIR